MKPTYLDYNATTPIDPAVVDAMLPFLRDHFGNPSSSHAYGKAAHHAVDRACGQVAELLGAQPDEIVFTGGGTEASNLALKGVIFQNMSARRVPRAACPPVEGQEDSRDLPLQHWQQAASGTHIITSAVEHPATLQPCDFLKRLGCKITVLPVDKFGLVEPESVRLAIDSSTKLVSIMHANNEVGTLQPIAQIAAIARQRGVMVHTDAAQSLGKLRVDVKELGVDLLTLAGHKLYAPKGIGVLYVRRGIKLEPLIHGAGHESGRRAGTENVAFIVGLGKACELAHQSLPRATQRLHNLREWLWQKLRDGLGDRVVLNGHPELRLPNTLNVNFVGQIGAELLRAVPEIAASTGSACHEGQVTLSPVLAAMGVPPEIGRGAVRLSVGRFTTEEDVDRAAEMLIAGARAK